MAAMSQRDRKALMLLGVAVALFLVLQLDMFAPSAASGSVASDAALDALEQRLQLAQVEARQRPLTEAELSAAQRRLEKVESRLLESADPALAQAEMRSLVGQLLDAEGIPLRVSRFGQSSWNRTATPRCRSLSSSLAASNRWSISWPRSPTHRDCWRPETFASVPTNPKSNPSP